MVMTKALKALTPFILILAIGIFFRIYNINFGLPQSFYADEPEIAEPAIKFTYEIKNITKNNDYYKLIPESFVYGTFPIYFYTVLVMIFSKVLGILNIGFEKMDLYVLMRAINTVISALLVPLSAFLYYKVFKDKFGAIATALITATGWKFIVMAHYVNVDTILTTLLLVSFITLYVYSKKKGTTFFTIFTGILFGLAVGTKITALLSFPLFIFIFLTKKDIKGMVAFILIVFLVFSISNPFSIIFVRRFAFKIISLSTKENGIVFDSINTNPLKYIWALFYILTPPIFLLSLYGKLRALRIFVKERSFHIFLIGNVLIYLIFYTLSHRLVDRWLMPILPVVIMYSAYGLTLLKSKLNKMNFVIILHLVLLIYVYFPILLLFQFQRQTPKSASYLWTRDNLIPISSKLVITEEGLDPLYKLSNAKVMKSEVYASKGAQYVYPLNPELFNYVILSSKPMENFKRKEIIEKFPEYSKRWSDFEKTVENTQKFKLIKSFELAKPNLIPLSNVYVYENIKFLPTKGNL